MLVSFNKCGYTYGDVDGTEFFSCGPSHDELFGFIGTDLTKLPSLLQQYMHNFIDFDTLELIEVDKKRGFFDEDSAPLREADEILCEAHPFFENGATNYLKDEINTFFIGLILNKTYDPKTYSLTNVYDRDWYLTRIRYLVCEGSYSDFYDDLCNKYADQYMEMTTQEEQPYEAYSEIPPVGFRSILWLQDIIQEWLYWILDVSASRLADLPITQRAYLYNELFPYCDDMPRAEITTRMSFTNPHGRHLGDCYRRSEDGGNTIYLLNGDLGTLHKTGQAPQEALDLLDNIVSSLIFSDLQPGVFDEYVIEDPYQLFFLEVRQMIKEEIRVKRCRHCNRYFIVTNLNTEYCDNIAPGEMEPCSKIGSKRAYKNKVNSDPALAAYQKSYKTHHARIRNAKMTKADFCKWADEAKLKLEAARSGTLSLNEFQKWLKQ